MALKLHSRTPSLLQDSTSPPATAEFGFKRLYFPVQSRGKKSKKLNIKKLRLGGEGNPVNSKLL